MTDDRYQFQPFHIRMYRRIRWMPQFVLLFLWELPVVLWQGVPPDAPWQRAFPTRWHLVPHLWITNMARAHMKMKDYKTGEEVLAEIKAKRLT